MVLVLSGCGFGGTCGAENPAVSRARLLSEEQLEFLHSEMFRLRRENSDPFLEYGYSGKATPDNLAFLEAVRIRPSRGLGPNVMLDGCMDEFVFLDFYGPDDAYPGDSPPRVVLSYSGGNATMIETEVLWESTVGPPE